MGLAKRFKRFWTAAKTKFCEEQRAAHHLERQGFEIYLPEIMELQTSGSERRELLFPGYIFIKIKRSWESIMGTRGISRLFLCQDLPARIPNNQIDYFRSLEDADGIVQLEPPLELGERVSGNEFAGSFRDISGVVKGMPRKNRVQVLLQILGRSIEVELDRRALKSAA